MTPEQKKSNLRLGLILGSIAVVIFVGFIAKSALIGMDRAMSDAALPSRPKPPCAATTGAWSASSRSWWP